MYLSSLSDKIEVWPEATASRTPVLRLLRTSKTAAYCREIAALLIEEAERIERQQSALLESPI